MKILFRIFIVFGICCCIISCNNSKSNLVTDSESSTAENIGKKVLETDLSKLTPYTLEEFEDWLPKKILNLQRVKSSKGHMIDAGIMGISGNYENGDKKFGVMVNDFAGSAAVMASMYKQLDNTVINETNANGYERNVSEGGIKAIEFYDESEQMYKVSSFYNQRFGVEIETHNMSRKEVWKAIKALGLNKL